MTRAQLIERQHDADHRAEQTDERRVRGERAEEAEPAFEPRVLEQRGGGHGFTHRIRTAAVARPGSTLATAAPERARGEQRRTRAGRCRVPASVRSGRARAR